MVSAELTAHYFALPGTVGLRCPQVVTCSSGSLLTQFSVEVPITLGGSGGGGENHTQPQGCWRGRSVSMVSDFKGQECLKVVISVLGKVCLSLF